MQIPADPDAHAVAGLQRRLQELEAQLRTERLKGHAARRDIEKLKKQTASDRQSIEEVLNDLYVEYTALKQTVDREASEAAETIRQRDRAISDLQTKLHDATAMLTDIRRSISFRVMVTAGRPVAAVQRLIRSVRSRGTGTDVC
jgi:chromosome segregation ATPase